MTDKQGQTVHSTVIAMNIPQNNITTEEQQKNRQIGKETNRHTDKQKLGERTEKYLNHF